MEPDARLDRARRCGDDDLDEGAGNRLTSQSFAAARRQSAGAFAAARARAASQRASRDSAACPTA